MIVKEKVSKMVRDIPPSGIRRFFDLAAEMKGVISLSIGEPDFVTPEHIRRVCIERINEGCGCTSYTSNHGMIELREAIAKDLFSRHGLTYNPREEILVTVGVSEAVDLLLRAILSPGEEVIIPQPCYVSYIPSTIMAGGVPVLVNTIPENNFKVMAEEIEAVITEKTKAILLCYPNNPTGAILTREDQEKIALVAKKHDLIIIADEIYSHLTYEGKHSCFASLPEMQERTVILDGFSKAYAMTGWRLGYAAGDPEIIDAMTKIHQITMLSAPTIAQIAALEALQNGAEEREKMIAEYNRRRRLMVKGFNDLGLTCFEPKGAFYTFPCIKSTGLSSEDFVERLLMEEKVALVPGSAFGPTGAGYVRCCYANSYENIEEALSRIERFLKKLSV